MHWLSLVILALFGIAWGIQVFFWAWVLRPLAIYKPETNVPDDMVYPAVTVIVCARNEAKNLIDQLPAFLEQQYPGPWEVLVVDDASEDDTPDILARFQAQYSHLRVLPLANKTTLGKKRALAEGIQAARYNLLLLSDADCAPATTHWITGMVQTCTLNQADVVLGYSPFRKKAGLLNTFVRLEGIYTAIQYASLALYGKPYMGVGRNLLYHKPLFTSLGGFSSHEHLPSGDDDLLVNAASRKATISVQLHPDTHVYTHGKETWTSYYRQKNRHLTAGTRYRNIHQWILGAWMGSHITVHVLAMYSLVYMLLFFSSLSSVEWQFGLLVSMGWLLRFALVYTRYRQVLPKLAGKDLQGQVWWFDAAMTVYYLILIPAAALRTKRW